MHYVVGSDAIRKTTVHHKDCENRKWRMVDDFRGFMCQRGEGAGYPSSSASVNFIIEKKGSGYQVNAMVATSSLIVQMYEEEGSAQAVFTNSTSILKNVRSSPGDISVSGDTITDISYEFSDGDYKWNQVHYNYLLIFIESIPAQINNICQNIEYFDKFVFCIALAKNPSRPSWCVYSET